MTTNIDDLLEEYRKTCFFVASNLDLDNEKPIQLMALTIINTKSALLNLLEEVRPEERHGFDDTQKHFEWGYNTAIADTYKAIKELFNE